jgi:hypothetical protein
MAVHAYFSGLITDILLIATILICIAGFWLLFTRWGQGRPGRFFSSWISESFLDGSRAFPVSYTHLTLPTIYSV